MRKEIECQRVNVNASEWESGRRKGREEGMGVSIRGMNESEERMVRVIVMGER